MVPVNLARTWEAGAADLESNASVHCTGSSAATAMDASVNKQTASGRSINQSAFAALEEGGFPLGSSASICSLILPSANSAATRIAFLIALALGRPGGM